MTQPDPIMRILEVLYEAGVNAGQHHTLMEDMEQVDGIYSGYKPAIKAHQQIHQAFKDAGYVDASRMLQLAELLQQQAEILKDMALVNMPPVYAAGLKGQEAG